MEDCLVKPHGQREIEWTILSSPTLTNAKFFFFASYSRNIEIAGNILTMFDRDASSFVQVWLNASIVEIPGNLVPSHDWIALSLTVALAMWS